MIIIRINMSVLPEKQKEVVQTLLSLMSTMEKESDCLSVALLCDMNDKNLMCVIEEWENRKKLDHHLKSGLFGIMLGIRSLLRQSHGINIYTIQQSEGMSAVHAAREKIYDTALIAVE